MKTLDDFLDCDSDKDEIREVAEELLRENNHLREEREWLLSTIARFVGVCDCAKEHGSKGEN